MKESLCSFPQQDPSADICIWQREHLREMNLWLNLTHPLLGFVVNILCMEITKILVKVENS